jgi:hypothetical protein
MCTTSLGENHAMPTKKPRIQVSLATSEYELVKRLAKLQERSMSQVLSDLFTEIAPVYERVAVVLQAAKRAQASAHEGFRSAAEKAQAEIAPHMAAAIAQFDIFEEQLGVTGGSKLAAELHAGPVGFPLEAHREAPPASASALASVASGCGGDGGGAPPEHQPSAAKAVGRARGTAPRRSVTPAPVTRGSGTGTRHTRPAARKVKLSKRRLAKPQGLQSLASAIARQVRRGPKVKR